MRDRAGRIRALALTLVLALGLLPSAVLAQSAVDGGQAESMADTQDAVVEAVADADQGDTADGEDPPDVIVPAEDEDVVADDETPAEPSSDVEDALEPAAEPVENEAAGPSEEPTVEPEAPSDGEPAAARGGEDTPGLAPQETGHTLTVRLGENSSQVQSMSMTYLSGGAEKTVTGTTEITATDVGESNSNITVTLTMRDGARYFAEIERDDDGSGGYPSLSSESGVVRVSLRFWQGFESDASFTLHDFVAAHEIKTGDAAHLRDTSYTYTYGDSSGSEDAAPEGALVTPRFHFEEGCYLKSYTVTNDTTGETTEYPAASNYDWSTYARPFTMPASSVTVTPTIERYAQHALTVRLGENSSQVQGMSMTYLSEGEEKTVTGTTEITVTDADENNSSIYVQLTMQDSTPYAVEASIAPSGGRFDFYGNGSIRIHPYGDLGSDTVITLDLAAMHEIKTGHTDPPVSGMRYYSHFGYGDTTAAPEGTEVTPRCYQPEEGYRLKSYTVTNDATGETTSYEADQPFTMPDSSVTVTPTILYGFTERTVTVRLGENSSQVQGMSMRYYDSNREWKTVEGTTEVTATDVADKYIIYNDASGDMAFKYDTVSVTVTMKDGRRYFAKVDPAIDNSWFGSRLSSWDGTLRLDSHTIISDTVFTLYDFVAASYGIEVGETEHGSISSLGISYGDTYSSFSASEDAILAPEGAQISLSPRPDEGYYLKSCTVTNNATGETTSYEADQPFTMPDSSVTVTPIFAPIVPIVDTIEVGNVSADIAASDGELSVLVPFTGTVDPDAPYTLTQERWVRMSDGRYVGSSPDAKLMQWLDKPLTSLSVGDELSYSFYVELRPGCEFADQVTVRVTTTTGETYTRIYAGNGRSGKLAGDIMGSTYTIAYDVFRVTVGEAKPPATTVTIAFDANGGDASSVPGSQDKVAGEDLVLPTSTPTRPDTTAPGYTVSYDANGGRGAPSAQTATVTTSYSFDSWNTLQDGTGDPYEVGGTYSADADATLYAQWSATAVAQPLVVAGTPVRDGHTFKGWNTSADGSGTPYAVGDPIDPAEDLTLYAQWEQDATAPTEDTYAVSSGDNGTWTQGSGEDYELTVDRVGDNDACFEHFRAVELDGRLLSEDEYEARSGSTIITLKAHVLQELSPGKHTVTVVFDDDRVDIDFTVKAASSGGTTPETPGTPGTPSTAPDTTGGSAQAPGAEKPQATPRTGDGSPSLLAFGLALASMMATCAGIGTKLLALKGKP